MKSVIDVSDLSVGEIGELIETAQDIADHPEKYAHACAGKILATLFFEPSTRTHLSFDSAMYSLGGNVISVSGIQTSSAAKGESVSDTAKVVSCYSDIIAMRHPKDGSALVAAKAARVPLINAGDGGHCHPTQTLADLLTVYREKGTFENLTVGLCGDLKYGRTVHSLIAALSRYAGVKFVFISPAELRIPGYIRYGVFEKNGIPYTETDSLDSVIGSLDILYMTRIQRERFEDPDAYERLKDSYILTEEKMKHAKPTCSVLHPLPRVNEISVKVDDDPRACYFKQVENGKLMRMALILKLLEEKKADPENRTEFAGDLLPYVCKNNRCISGTEQELPARFINKDGVIRCAYCESRARSKEI